jgi:hypothetical protein
MFFYHRFQIVATFLPLMHVFLFVLFRHLAICKTLQNKGLGGCPRMMYDSSLYVEKSAWDPSVYVNTPAVFGAKSYVSSDQPVPIASGSPAFGFALRVIVERPAKRAKYARFVCMF